MKKICFFVFSIFFFLSTLNHALGQKNKNVQKNKISKKSASIKKDIKSDKEEKVDEIYFNIISDSMNQAFKLTIGLENEKSFRKTEKFYLIKSFVLAKKGDYQQARKILKKKNKKNLKLALKVYSGFSVSEYLNLLKLFERNLYSREKLERILDKIIGGVNQFQSLGRVVKVGKEKITIKKKYNRPYKGLHRAFVVGKGLKITEIKIVDQDGQFFYVDGSAKKWLQDGAKIYRYGEQFQFRKRRIDELFKRTSPLVSNNKNNYYQQIKKYIRKGMYWKAISTCIGLIKGGRNKSKQAKAYYMLTSIFNETNLNDKVTQRELYLRMINVLPKSQWVSRANLGLAILSIRDTVNYKNPRFNRYYRNTGTLGEAIEKQMKKQLNNIPKGSMILATKNHFVNQLIVQYVNELNLKKKNIYFVNARASVFRKMPRRRNLFGLEEVMHDLTALKILANELNVVTLDYNALLANFSIDRLIDKYKDLSSEAYFKNQKNKPFLLANRFFVNYCLTHLEVPGLKEDKVRVRISKKKIDSRNKKSKKLKKNKPQKKPSKVKNKKGKFYYAYLNKKFKIFRASDGFFNYYTKGDHIKNLKPKLKSHVWDKAMVNSLELSPREVREMPARHFLNKIYDRVSFGANQSSFQSGMGDMAAMIQLIAQHNFINKNIDTIQKMSWDIPVVSKELFDITSDELNNYLLSKQVFSQKYNFEKEEWTEEEISDFVHVMIKLIQANEERKINLLQLNHLLEQRMEDIKIRYYLADDRLGASGDNVYVQLRSLNNKVKKSYVKNHKKLRPSKFTYINLNTWMFSTFIGGGAITSIGFNLNLFNQLVTLGGFLGLHAGSKYFAPVSFIIRAHLNHRLTRRLGIYYGAAYMLSTAYINGVTADTTSVKAIGASYGLKWPVGRFGAEMFAEINLYFDLEAKKSVAGSGTERFGSLVNISPAVGIRF